MSRIRGGFLMADRDQDFDRLRDRVSDVEKEIAAHKAACEERHKEINRRFDHADNGRRDLYAKIEAGTAELRGMFTTAHNDNRNSISRVERGSLERSFDFAKAILLVAIAGALGYFLRR